MKWLRGSFRGMGDELQCVARVLRYAYRVKCTNVGRWTTLFLLLCALACGPGVAGADAGFRDSTWVAPSEMFKPDSTTDGPRVAPPDHERRWETALRLPFRIIFIPFRLIAMGMEAAAGYIGPHYIEPKPKRPPKTGPQISPLLDVGAVNDIALGADVTWQNFLFANDKLDASASWSTFDGRVARLSETLGYERPLSLRLGIDYRHNVNRKYYGIGNDTPPSDISYFKLATTNAEAAILIGGSRLRQARLVGGYSSMTPGTGSHGSPLLEDVFTPAEAPFAQETTQEYWLGVAGDYTAIDDDRDPSSGVDLRGDLRRAYGVRSSDPDYYQWRVEARTYARLFAKRRVIALRTVYAGIDPQGNTTILPFYRLSESRGDTHFAAYSSERFRDQQLLLGRIEYRWPIISRLNVFGLYELGEVAPRTGAFTLTDAHVSYGGGLRYGVGARSAVRMELASGSEGLHLVLGLGSDF
jgi:hypothetical protein